MKTLVVLAALLGALTAAAGPRDDPDGVNSNVLATPNGKLKLAGGYNDRHDIFVDGKRVFATPRDSVELLHHYRVGKSDVVFFSGACGGNACGPDPLYFLVLRHGTKPRVVADADFYSADGSTQPGRQVRNVIVIELGYEKGLEKWAEFDGERLRIRRASSAVRGSATMIAAG